MDAIKTRVMKAHEGMSIKPVYQDYAGKDDGGDYITFFCVVERPEAYGDNQITASYCLVQVDYWSKGSMEDVITESRENMIAAGFRFSAARDFYESDTKIFHRIQEFSFYEEE